MNTDIRLSVGFWQHPKTKKTLKRLGFEGIRSLQILWMWAAMNRPDGNFYGMNWEDIELAADWLGEEKAFFNVCVGEEGCPMWIDVTEEGYALHSWEEHNPWVVKSDVRSDKARFSRLATVNREVYEELKAKGIGAISKKEYDTLTTVGRISDDSQPLVEQAFDESSTPAPSPTPSPVPSPVPVPSLRIDCSEQSSLPNKHYVSTANISAIALPLNTGEEHTIKHDDIELWKTLYPSVDIVQELRNMQGWLIGNPKRRKTKAGIGRFIQAWLAKAQDRPVAQPAFSAKHYTSFSERRREENETAAKLAKELLFGQNEGVYAQERL